MSDEEIIEDTMDKCMSDDKWIQEKEDEEETGN